MFYSNDTNNLSKDTEHDDYESPRLGKKYTPIHYEHDKIKQSDTKNNDKDSKRKSKGKSKKKNVAKTGAALEKSPLEQILDKSSLNNSTLIDLKENSVSTSENKNLDEQSTVPIIFWRNQSFYLEGFFEKRVQEKLTYEYKVNLKNSTHSKVAYNLFDENKKRVSSIIFHCRRDSTGLLESCWTGILEHVIAINKDGVEYNIEIFLPITVNLIPDNSPEYNILQLDQFYQIYNDTNNSYSIDHKLYSSLTFEHLCLAITKSIGVYSIPIVENDDIKRCGFLGYTDTSTYVVGMIFWRTGGVEVVVKSAENKFVECIRSRLESIEYSIQ